MKMYFEYIFALSALLFIHVADVRDGGVANWAYPVSIQGLDKKSSARVLYDNFVNVADRCKIGSSDFVSSLSNAIVSVEIGATSKIEAYGEKAVLAIFGDFYSEIPDFSYGIAQIKPSTIRKTLNINLSNQQIKSILSDDCQSIATNREIVDVFVYEYCQKSDDCGQIKSERIVDYVAKRYNGQISTTIESYVYRKLVEEIFSIQYQKASKTV